MLEGNIAKRRREICEWLGFPPQESVVRMLARVPPQAVSMTLLYALRSVCHDPNCLRTLGFVRRINADVVALLANQPLRGLCSTDLLNDVGARTACDNSPQMLYTILSILGRRPGPQSFFRSAEEIIRMHEDVQAEQQHDCENMTFDLPPIPPQRPVITPITNRHELIAWGERNSNCCATYWQRILRGETYLYKIETADGILATLALKRKSNGWAPSQLAEAFNQRPRPEIRKLVNEWLAIYASNQDDTCASTRETSDTPR